VDPGDRIRVVEGSADIVYENGALVTVQPGQTAVVLANAPAATGMTFDISDTAFVAGGLLIGAGAGLAIALSKNGPASP
jgi:hypothetical protein